MTAPRPLPVSIVVLASIFALLSLAGEALAAQRYAVPSGGKTSGTCAKAIPCQLNVAVGASANGDEVIVEPGEYNVTVDFPITIASISVHGTTPTAKPRIVTAADEHAALAVLGPGSSIYDLVFASSGSGGFPALRAGEGARIDRVFASSRGAGAIVTESAEIRDSIAYGTGPSSAAIYLNANGASTVVNSTAIGTGPSSYGVSVRTSASGGSASATVRNTIARGTKAGLSLQAEKVSDSASIDIGSSNYDFAAVAKFGLGKTSLTDTGGSQDAALVNPLLLDVTGGDPHQLSGSPTIDAGLASSLLGPIDFDGDPRIVGAAPDIGADEFPAVSVAPGPARPTLSALHLKRKGFRVKGGPKKKRGTAFSFTLDQAASVGVTIRKVVKRGRKTSFPTVGTLARQGSAGANSIAFSGRIKGKPLTPGRYRADLIASGAGGSSDVASVRFRVLPPPR